jgi:hypothetical protein
MNTVNTTIAGRVAAGEFSVLEPRHTKSTKVITEPFTADDTNEVVPAGTEVDVYTYEDGSRMEVAGGYIVSPPAATERQRDLAGTAPLTPSEVELTAEDVAKFKFLTSGKRLRTTGKHAGAYID